MQKIAVAQIVIIFVVLDRNHNSDCSDIDTFIKTDHVNIGDWCIFEKGGRLLIALVHTSLMAMAKTLKKKIF